MTTDNTIKISTPEVIFEAFDDEIVLINLDNGNYYSLDKVAAKIWKYIVEGVTKKGIIERVDLEYIGPQNIIETKIDNFFEKLLTEGLITFEEFAITEENNPENNFEARTNSIEFDEPILSRYSDMQDLLLLDPIHEVDDAGWPKT
jgi:hypothetical protein